MEGVNFKRVQGHDGTGLTVSPSNDMQFDAGYYSV